jgi:hypothetical protein
MGREIHRLVELGLRRKELDQALAEIQRQREDLDRQIREVAAVIAGGPGGPEVYRPTEVAADGIQPRQAELLRLMLSHGLSNAAELADAMFNSTDRSKMKGVAAYLSRLKSGGYVEHVEGARGRYKLTRRGKALAEAGGGS